MKAFILFANMMVLFACSSNRKVSLGPGGEDIYFSNGVESYFLPSIPAWANFSSAGSCFRKKEIKFLNFEKLNHSYGLNYFQLLQLQLTFNQRLNSYKESTGKVQISLADEDYIFHNVYQQVQGKSYDFNPPAYPKVSIIWVDAFLKNPEKIRKTLLLPQVQEGFPILLSHCLSLDELESFAEKHQLDEFGVKYLSSELLSVYNAENNKTTSFTFELTKVLPEKEIFFFGISKSHQLKGQMNFIKIK